MKKPFQGLSFLLFLVSCESAFATSQFALPCIDSSGKVANAKEEDVCRSILPKCSDLRNQLLDNMKSMISWKIYGYYYLNKDIDLNQDPALLKDPSKVKGETLPYPICSVVGDKLTSTDTGEIEKQKVGLKLSCGEFPRIVHGPRSQYRSSIVYEGELGKRWFSWVQGALPWELRRNAADIEEQLKPDLSNLDEVIESSAQKQEIAQSLISTRKAVLDLNGRAKEACHTTSNSIVESCKKINGLLITDPVQRVCTLAKAQLALNSVATPNMLVYEVMGRTKTMHDKYFRDIFVRDGSSSGSSNGEFRKLLNHCSDNSNLMGLLAQLLDFWPFKKFFRWLKANKSYSCFTSCMLDGEQYYTDIQDRGPESCKNCGGENRRKCVKKSRFSLESGKPVNVLFQSMIDSESQTTSSWDGWSWISVLNVSTAKNFKDQISAAQPAKMTNNTGFAAMVEKIIRKDICKQTKKSDKNLCDDVDIPNKPKNLKE